MNNDQSEQFTGVNWYEAFTFVQRPSGENNYYILKPICWTPYGSKNVHLTLEWIIRPYRVTLRSAPDNQNVYGDKFITHRIGESNWYRSLFTKHESFLHVCDTSELLKFRLDYESRYNNIYNSDLPLNIQSYTLLTELSRNFNFNVWSVIGRDGVTVQRWGDSFGQSETPSHQEAAVRINGFLKPPVFTLGAAYYEMKCRKCSDPLPKSVQALLKLEKLKSKL